jgi:hypothetical protein
MEYMLWTPDGNASLEDFDSFVPRRVSCPCHAPVNCPPFHPSLREMRTQGASIQDHQIRCRSSWPDWLCGVLAPQGPYKGRILFACGR